VADGAARAAASLAAPAVPDHGEAGTRRPALDGAVQLAPPSLDDDQRASRLAGSLVVRRLGRARGGGRDEPPPELLDITHAERRHRLLQRPRDLAHPVLGVGDESPKRPGVVVERDHLAAEGLQLPPQQEADGRDRGEREEGEGRRDAARDAVERGGAPRAVGGEARHGEEPVGLVRGSEREADPVPGVHAPEDFGALDRKRRPGGGKEPRDPAVLDRDGAPPRIDCGDTTLSVEGRTGPRRSGAPDDQKETERDHPGWAATRPTPAIHP
jgi:hypothetical protein